MNIPPPGDYKAKANGPFNVGLSTKGALCATLPCIISQGPHTGFTCEWLGVLFKSEEDGGEAMTNTIDNLKEVFGWDGSDINTLLYSNPGTGDPTPRLYPEIEFTLAQCKNEEFEGKMRFKPGFLNSDKRRIQLKPISPKDVMTKYGSRFRALAGGSPVRPAAAPSAPRPSAAPIAPTAAGCTKDEAWQAFQNDRPGADHEKLWFAAINEIGKPESQYTSQDWAALRAKLLGDNKLS